VIDQIKGDQIPGRQLQRIEQYTHLATGPPNQFGFRNLKNGFHFIVHLGGQPSQHKMIIGSGMERQRQNRDIINGVRFDHGPGNAVGNSVKIGLQLLVQPDNGRFQILPHIETDHQHTPAGHGGGVDILHAGQFIEQLFHGHAQALFDLFGAGSGHGNHDINHGHLNLGFLFPGQHGNGHEPEQKRGNNTDQCQFGVNKGCG